MFPSFGVSNIAWPADQWTNAIGVLCAHKVTEVEIAPFNVWKRWDVSDEEIRTLRSEINDSGLACTALQGLLFGVPNVHLFASDESRRELFTHLQKIARMAETLGAKACVFGAPKQRDPGELPAADAWNTAVDFFRRAAKVFADHGSAIAFEANARLYGCRFIVTTREAASFVVEVDHVGCGLQIDTGTMFLEAEDPSILSQAASVAIHAHISEPGLVPIGTAGTNHKALAAALSNSGYAGSLSIEMAAAHDWGAELEKSILFARATYSL